LVEAIKNGKDKTFFPLSAEVTFWFSCLVFGAGLPLSLVHRSGTSGIGCDLEREWLV
jgi:hypothetical protein